MGDLHEHAHGLNPKEAARLLLYRPRYSNETLFRGIHRLTERATAHFGSHLHIRYPDPALHSGPREHADGADVLGAFTRVIDTALAQRPWQPETTVFYLTGGFDSGTVATRAAQQHPGQLATATLLIGGPGRPQQIRRRKEILGAVPFADYDTLTDAMADLPLAPACARQRGELGRPGLADGYHLRRRSLGFVILDAQASPGGAWRHMWDSLHLFSPAEFSSLPGG